MNLFMTQQAHDKKLVEITIVQKKLEAAKIDMNEAKEQGDLSENAGYTYAREDVEKFNTQIAERIMEMSGVNIVDPKEWAELDMEDSPRCMLGALVTIQRAEKEETYLIGGAGDHINGVLPYNSPLGKTLIPKAEGKTVFLQLGDTEEEIKILSCKVATREYIENLYKEPSRENPPKKNPAPKKETEMDMA